MNPLEPRRLMKSHKKVKPYRTKEGADFRREAGKLDNWINHRRIDEYFKEPRGKPSDRLTLLSEKKPQSKRRPP